LSYEWVVVGEVGAREVVLRIAKYSETRVSCRVGRQVLGLSHVRPLL
jgi:hypothetical protein